MPKDPKKIAHVIFHMKEKEMNLVVGEQVIIQLQKYNQQDGDVMETEREEIMRPSTDRVM